MAAYTVHICDRCFKTYSDEETDPFMPPNWVDINYMQGPPTADPPEDWDGPENESYLFCDDCAPPVLRDLKSWVPQKASG